MTRNLTQNGENPAEQKPHGLRCLADFWNKMGEIGEWNHPQQFIAQRSEVQILPPAAMSEQSPLCSDIFL